MCFRDGICEIMEGVIVSTPAATLLHCSMELVRSPGLYKFIELIGCSSLLCGGYEAQLESLQTVTCFSALCVDDGRSRDAVSRALGELIREVV